MEINIKNINCNLNPHCKSMMFSYIEPEVPGSFAEGTDLDASVHPPIVKCFNFQFYGWLGDCLLECFPCFLISEPAKVAVQITGLSGIFFANIYISKSSQFDELHPEMDLPEFFWMKVTSRAGTDDFGLTQDYRLVLSGRALAVLRPFGLEEALISEYP